MSDDSPTDAPTAADALQEAREAWTTAAEFIKTEVAEATDSAEKTYGDAAGKVREAVEDFRKKVAKERRAVKSAVKAAVASVKTDTKKARKTAAKKKKAAKKKAVKKAGATKKKAVTVGSSFQSGNRRFAEPAVGRRAPGPGAYYKDESALVKRSFNITVGDSTW